ncbi:MAG: branched-chain amino acid ABC transporter permease [Thermodesulfobacteriota bacterium]|jgi:branched-chain amino acid transport system permease protein
MKREDLFLFLLLSAIVFVVPLFIKNSYYISILVFFGINAIMAVGLCLLLGYSGQISLAHAGFFGIGAYSSAIVTMHGLPPIVGVAIGIILTILVALTIGIPTLRLRGHYLGLATICAGEVIFICFKEMDSLTGGPSGLPDIPLFEIGSIVLTKPIHYYYMAWILALAVIYFSLNLVNTRIGRAVLSFRYKPVGSEDGALSVGIDVTRYRIKIFVLSTIFCSLAGSVYAHFMSFISPENFDLNFSTLLLIMIVVGGMGSIWGAIWGAGIMTYLPELLRAFKDFDTLIYGGILIGILVFMPEGLRVCFSQSLFGRFSITRRGNQDQKRGS